MKIRGLQYGNLLKLLLVSLSLPLSLWVNGQDSTLVAVGNLKGVPASMKMSELKSVLKGEKQRWSDGTKVIIAMVKSTTPIGKSVSSKIYSMSGDGVRSFWAGISFAGKFDPPNVFNTLPEVETFVAQNPGAIAIIDKSSALSDVKTILIDGKKSF
ncbi:MAG: hypothetical protein ACHQET_14215 [Chitinophagales bacterium]